MATNFCPHCGEKKGFQVNFNIVCRIGDEEEKGYLRTCKDCGGRLITTQKDERKSLRLEINFKLLKLLEDFSPGPPGNHGDYCSGG